MSYAFLLDKSAEHKALYGAAMTELITRKVKE